MEYVFNQLPSLTTDEAPSLTSLMGQESVSSKTQSIIVSDSFRCRSFTEDVDISEVTGDKAPMRCVISSLLSKGWATESFSFTSVL